jgi:hypothetical protein
MQKTRTHEAELKLRELLVRDNTLNGGILFGLEGYVIEVQARAMEVLKRPCPWTVATRVSGMAGVAVREATTRIAGAFAKLRIPDPEVAIQVNLTPSSVLKEGTWLDLPLAIIMLQAAGVLGRGRRFVCRQAKLENTLRNEIHFEPVIAKAVDFGAIRGQKAAKEAAIRRRLRGPPSRRRPQRNSRWRTRRKA